MPHYTLEISDANWSTIINRLLRRHIPEDKRADMVEVEIAPNGFQMTYRVEHEALPAEELAKTLGVSVEALVKPKKIVLKPIIGDANWPAPTVDYWGEA